MAYRIVIAGLGQAARRIHLPAYMSIPNLQVVGGCDPAVKQGQFSFPLFTSVLEMLERTNPHILAVVTPPDSHFALTCLGLQAGCHVFCEKPFTTTLDEADVIIGMARDAGRHVVVNNQFRFMRIHQAAKQMIGTAEFGDLAFLTMHQTFFVTEQTEAGWRGKTTRRTGMEFGTHVMDLSRYFFDENPSSINARMPRGKELNGPDYLNLIQLEFSGDRVAHIILDRLSRGRHRYLDIRLDGKASSIETSLGGRLEICAGLRSVTRKPFITFDFALGGRARLYRGESFSTLEREPADVFASATGKLMKAFLTALERNQRPPCDCIDNRHTLALMLAAYESDARRTTIAMA